LSHCRLGRVEKRPSAASRLNHLKTRRKRPDRPRRENLTQNTSYSYGRPTQGEKPKRKRWESRPMKTACAHSTKSIQPRRVSNPVKPSNKVERGEQQNREAPADIFSSRKTEAFCAQSSGESALFAETGRAEQGQGKPETDAAKPSRKRNLGEGRTKQSKWGVGCWYGRPGPFFTGKAKIKRRPYLF